MTLQFVNLNLQELPAPRESVTRHRLVMIEMQRLIQTLAVQEQGAIAQQIKMRA